MTLIPTPHPSPPSAQLKSITSGLDYWRQAVELHNDATMAPLPNVLPSYKGLCMGSAGPAPGGGCPPMGTLGLEALLAYVACYLPPQFTLPEDM